MVPCLKSTESHAVSQVYYYPDEHRPGDQFPNQADADKALKELDTCADELERIPSTVIEDVRVEDAARSDGGTERMTPTRMTLMFFLFYQFAALQAITAERDDLLATVGRQGPA